MNYNNQQILEYWNDNNVESMYDKNLINLEIELIKRRIKEGTKILDAGCGEGEGTQIYSDIPNTIVHGADFSETRLKLAEARIGAKSNVVLKQVDFTKKFDLDANYDAIVSQRFLINLTDWELQKTILSKLASLLNPNGKLILLEGCQNGVDELNQFRKLYGLEPIPVKWHNLFFKDDQLVKHMASLHFKLVEEDGLGEYFLLTRGLRPVFEKDLDWNSSFNKTSSSLEVKNLIRLNHKFSRLKLWVFSRV